MTRILAIETSCDETAAAVVEDGQRICSNVVASQIDIHGATGAFFPEIASRQHILAMTPVTEEALAQAHITWNDLDAVAVTYGPGWPAACWWGDTAKGIALALGRPLIGVNHLEGTCTPTGSSPMGKCPSRAFPRLPHRLGWTHRTGAGQGALGTTRCWAAPWTTQPARCSTRWRG